MYFLIKEKRHHCYNTEREKSSKRSPNERIIIVIEVNRFSKNVEGG